MISILYKNTLYLDVKKVKYLWSILKRKVYEKNWKAETLNQFKLRIAKCPDELDQDLVNRLFRDTRLRLARVRSNGLLEDNFFF